MIYKNIYRIYSPLSIIIFFLLALVSCEPNTIEKQIEEIVSATEKNDIIEIAYSLADSLDTKASELLIAQYPLQTNVKEKIKWGLEGMIFRYSRTDDSRVEDCVSYITDPNPLHELKNDNKLDLIIYGLSLSKTNDEFKSILTNSALKHNEKGMLKLIAKWKQDRNSKVILDAIKIFDEKAVSYLSELITEDEYAVNLLARIGEPAIPEMKRKMRSNSQSVRFAAGDVLVKMIEYHPDALINLTSSINQQGIKTIAENYIFYIRLGQPGSENIILKALRYNFSYTMCLDLLNCGSSYIEEGAAEIARNNGYSVTSGIGSHPGPRWGSSK
jgi:hypothetical protein